MTPEQKQQLGNSDAWKYWKYWSTWKKISMVVFILTVLAWYVFWNHILPKLAEDEQKAGRAAAKSAPNLQISKPDVPIPPNPNTRF